MNFKVNFKNIQPYGVQEEDLEKVYNKGEISQYNKFWDIYQKKGTLTYYDATFANSSWSDENFKPKYDLKGNFYGTFENCEITDLKKILNDCNVVLDTSNANTFQDVFKNCDKITHIPYLDLRNVTSTMLSCFYYCVKLNTIDGINIGDKYTSWKFSSNFFAGCSSLKHCIIEGKIVDSGFNMGYCDALNKESIESVINCLSTETSGQSVTLSLRAVDKAFETSENANNGSTSSEWTNLINKKTNWTINLA